MTIGGRRGNTLVVVLAIALLLASQIYIVNVLSSGNFRHVEKVNSHVRAIYVGESALSKLIARLKGAPWGDRWFRGGPVEENNVPLVGGTYSSYAATVPDPTQKLADFWVRGKYEGSTVAMFARVHFVDDTLDFHAQVYPKFFTFQGPDSEVPRAGAPTLTLIEEMIRKQEQNKQRAKETLDRIRGRNDFAGVAGELQIPLPPGPVPDRTSPPTGASRPQSDYLAGVDLTINVNLGIGLPAGIPPGTAPGSPEQIAAAVPNGLVDFHELIRHVVVTLNGLGVPPDLPGQLLDPVLGNYYQDPNNAYQKWVLAVNPGPGNISNPNSPRWKDRLDNAAQLLEDMAKKGTCGNCRSALDSILEYLRYKTQKALERWPNLPPPDAVDKLDPGPQYTPGDYKDAYIAYAEWFNRHGKE
jgi:hypothetical protein